MKRIISLMLLCSVLILCLSGCSSGNNSDNEVKEELPLELQKNSPLVIALAEYLISCRSDLDQAPYSTATKIDAIKEGTQALHVGLDSSSCYFVGAYYDKNSNENETFYNWPYSYTYWVKYESASEIREQYKGVKLEVAFQINRAAFVTDIMSKDASVPNIEHFQIYTPTFTDGVNTNGVMRVDKTFIFLNIDEIDNVYYSLLYEGNDYYTFPCVFIDGGYSIPVKIYTVLPDGSRKDHNASIAYDFGEYYDALMGVMNTEGYSVTDEEGRTASYGLIKLEDFCRCIEE